MMENRSFDHLLGWMKRIDPRIDGLTGSEYNSVNVSNPDSEKVYVSDQAEYVDPDPGHNFSATKEQIFGGTSEMHLKQDPPPMHGFAQQAESMISGFSKRVMSAFRPEALPVTTALAQEFAVFDRWFSSIPGPTQPNRFYLHSATSHGAIANIIPDLLMGFPQRTIYDDIHDAGKTFGIYFHDAPSTLFFSQLRQVQHLDKFHWFDKFKSDARAGKLPSFSFLEPRYFDLWGYPANDDHPSHDVSEGQWLIKEVYETLRSSPQWNESVLVITYDEHGGFYDHVPTPTKDVPNPDGMTSKPEGFAFNRLGVRVPTIVISPWVSKGTVVHEAQGPTPTSQYEHSSVPATVRKILNLTSSPLTKREAWAGTFDWLLAQRGSPRTDCPETLPSPDKPLRQTPPNEDALLTGWQHELVQMAYTLDFTKAGENTANASVRRRLESAERLNVRRGSSLARRAVRRFLQGRRDRPMLRKGVTSERGTS